MRARVLALAVVTALGATLLTSLPASAAHTVTIDFPGAVAEYYSPFSGPATITVEVDPSDTDETFTARLRLSSGGSVIASTPIGVLNEDTDGVVTKSFTWNALSVTTLTQYDVEVWRDGALVTEESFFLYPQLVRITGITPNPFFPWRDDGYKDVTHVRYSLGNDADVEVHVHQPKSTGACCGSIVRNADLGMRSAGANVWDWDGRNDGGTNLPVGDYYVRVRADDGTLAPAVSRPAKVTIRRTYRTTATTSKSGKAYHHTSESVLVRGGDCFTFNGANYLEVNCHGAKMTVYYRWGLRTNEWITRASFVIYNPNGECGTSKWDPGYSKHESRVTVVDNVAGNTACRIVTARITYSYLKSS
jgi:hypothetical protein